MSDCVSPETARESLLVIMGTLTLQRYEGKAISLHTVLVRLCQKVHCFLALPFLAHVLTGEY
jgi:hypothetical protein